MKFYDFELEYSNNCFIPSTVTNLTAPKIPVQGKKVLDLGCGIGPLSIYFAKNGAAWVTATDIYDEHIKYARINAQKHNVDIGIVQGNLFENINDTYDIICCDVSGIDKRVAELTDWFPSGVPLADETGNNLICKAIEEAPKYLNEGGEMYICVSSFSDVEMLKSFIGDKGGPIFEKKIPFNKALNEQHHLLDPSTYTQKGSRKMWTFSLWKI